MNDRAAFLHAIQLHPADDTPRLVYADWLDENGTLDVHKATAEFIRVSCLGRNDRSGLMPRKAYQWIGEHWHRLVPLTLGLHVWRWHANTPAADEIHTPYLWYRDGRRVQLELTMHVKPGSGAVNYYRMGLEFNRGFVQWWEVFEPDVFERVRDALKVEQPLARARTFPVSDGWQWQH